MRVGGLFDGVGLLAYGLHLAGLRHAWLCEIDPWRRSVLELRWPGVPVFDDVRAVGAGTACRVDVIAGGFPCKGASTAGKRTGFDHPETVLWREMARAVGELRPRYVVVENVANILALKRGAVWGEVVGTLAALGYDVVWDCLPAGAVGAPHLRDRVFAIAAHADESRADAHATAGGPWRTTGERAGAATDAVGSGGPVGRGRQCARDGEPRAWRRDHAEPGDKALADSGLLVSGRGPGELAGSSRARESEAPQRQRVRGDAGHGSPSARGVAVEWGDYELAIRRWEAVHGPAPEPLVRRVDDRGAARVERSRLAALGDGVQVQIGQLVGEHIMRDMRRIG